MDIQSKAGRREWIGLAVLALPTLLASLDMSVLFLALPHLAADLHADSTEQLWILDIYGFMLAGFLVTMGTLGDRIGRRRLLMFGASAFGVASVVAAWSSSAEMLIAARAVLGIAGATLMPSTLALIRNMFHDAKQRGAAIAVWMSCFMVGTAIGPLIGGAMLELFWWGSVFLLAVPVMAVLLTAAPALLPEYRDESAGRVDLASVALSLAAILPVIYGLKESARLGAIEVAPVVAVLAGLGFGAVFVSRQRMLARTEGRSPLLDLRLFADRSFRSCMVIMFCGAVVMSGTFFFIPTYLQLVVGLSPLHAGLWMLPQAVAMIGSTQLTPVLARRFRPAHLMAVALSVAALGCVLLAFVDVSGGLPLLVTGFLLACVGVAPPTMVGTELLITSVAPEKAGSAASVSETSNELGIALGLAILGSVGTIVYRGGVSVPVEAPAAAGESMAGATAAAPDLAPSVAAELMDSARAAFTSGLNTVTAAGAVLFAAIAVVALVTLRHRPVPAEVSAPAEEPVPVG